MLEQAGEFVLDEVDQAAEDFQETWKFAKSSFKTRAVWEECAFRKLKGWLPA